MRRIGKRTENLSHFAFKVSNSRYCVVLYEVQFIPLFSTDFISGSSPPIDLDLRFKTLCYYFSTAANYSYVSFSTMWQKPSPNLVRVRSYQIFNETVAESSFVEVGREQEGYTEAFPLKFKSTATTQVCYKLCYPTN
jgi:hypothetical protein